MHQHIPIFNNALSTFEHLTRVYNGEEELLPAITDGVPSSRNEQVKDRVPVTLHNGEA